jgi:hypothetical protein
MPEEKASRRQNREQSNMIGLLYSTTTSLYIFRQIMSSVIDNLFFNRVRAPLDKAARGIDWFFWR